MKLKTLALAVAALAVLSVIAWFLQRPPAPAAADPRVGQPVLAATTLARTARIRLTDQGKTVLLVRQSDGPWIDSSYYDLPADFSKLSRFTDDLASAKVQRVVTRNPEVLARLSFKDTAVALLDAGGKELWRLTLGKGAESGGRFVQFADEPTGYLANLSVFLDADAKNWADSLLIVLKPEDVAAVEVGFAEGEPVVATRAKKEDAWIAAKAPAGQRIDEAKVTSLLSSLTSLRFQDTSDPNDPNVTDARQHSRTIKFTTFDHTTITIELRRKPEEKKPEARSQKSEVGDQGSMQANPESSLSAEASAKPATQNSEPTAATAVSALATQNSEPRTQNSEPAAAPAAQPSPAGPVYAFISSSDPAAPVNALMKKRAFQVYDWNYTSLPQKPDELFEAVPAPPPVERKTETNPAERTPTESKAETEPVAPATPEATPAAAPAKP
jgi:hypothetical protein